MRHRSTTQHSTTLALALALGLSTVATAQTGVNPARDEVSSKPKIYSPYVARTVRNNNFAEGVYWGDTHLHTSYSTDAGMIGNTLPPEAAYKFALGEEVVTSSGQRALPATLHGQEHADRQDRDRHQTHVDQ